MDNHSKLRKAIPYICCVAGLLLGGLIGWIARKFIYVDQIETHWETVAVIACVIIFAILVWVLTKQKNQDE